MSEHDDVEVWDFAVPDKPKRFKFNGPEVYEAPAVISPATMRKLASMRGHLGGDTDATDRFDQIRDLFAQILTPESRKRFIDRFESEDDPIDLTRQLVPALHRLMEAYGMRPTQQSSPSSDGGGDTDTTSTAGQPPLESFPNSFQPTVGSTSATTGS